MPVFYDPYTALRFQQQGQALGGKPLTPDQMEAMGYGVTSALSDKQTQAQGMALQEKSLAERRREFDINAGLEEDKLAQSNRSGLISAGLQAPMTYYSAQKLGIIPEDMGIQSTVKGWFGSGTTPTATGGQALTTGLGPTEAATTSTMPAGEYASMGATAMNATTTGQAIATSGMPGGEFAAASQGGELVGGAGYAAYGPVIGGAALAGSLGAQYGPFKQQSEDVATLGMGGKKEKKVAGGALRGAGAGAATGAMIGSVVPGIGTGVGAIVGTIVGAVAGGGSSTVICTELYRQGFISQELLDIEKIYQPNFDWQTYWGYRNLADPIVRGMKKSHIFTKIVSIFGIAFLNEVAHRVDPTRNGSHFGSLLIGFGISFCKWNYRRYQRKYGKFNARFHRVVEE